MPAARTFSDNRLVNGSTGDPVLFIDYPGKNDAYLFDAGDLGVLPRDRLADLQAVCITHHHMDHVTDLDRVLRANLDHDKVVHVFGPEGTIEKIYRRIQCFELRYFPFMKVVLRVHDVMEGQLDSADLDCAQQFPEPVVTRKRWKGPVIFENEEVKLEAVIARHTAPCLAYALTEKATYHLDRAKLAQGTLRPGPWMLQALALLRSGSAADTLVDIEGGQFPLGVLAEQYFTKARGARVAFVTDTVWDDKTQPALTKLAQRATRLYCDSYFAGSQVSQARKHKHMTATFAAELAKAAHADELILMHFASRHAGKYADLVEEARGIFANVRAEF